jgi:signal transduction histidine kinase
MKKALACAIIIVFIFFLLLILMFIESLFFVRFGMPAVYFTTLIFSIILFFACGFLCKKIGNRTAKGMNTEFVSTVAHNLKTSLSAIKWSLRMLIDGDFGKNSEEQKEVALRLYKKNEAAISALDDLLNLSKIEDGAYIYKKNPADIISIILSVMDDYKDEIKSKNIELEFEKPEYGVPKMRLDEEKIRIAIQNIFDNAVKYTSAGGKIKVCLKHTEKEIEIEIQDSGIGIPEQQQINIFRKFFRGDNAVQTEFDGSGLGLFIAGNIISAHKGKIWFESEENKGTTFYISLPVVK